MRFATDKSEKISLSNRKLLGMAALALFVSVAVTACGDQKTAQQPPRPVKVTVVAPPLATRTLTYSGVITPRIESALGFRVSGKIVERYVNVGDQVHQGQNIARLDETDLKLSENSARANVRAAETRLAVAKDSLARATDLYPKGYIAKATVDQRQLEADSAQSALNAAQDQLNQAVNATGYALLVATKDGIVTSVRAEPGQVVSVGQAVITLAEATDTEVAVSIPEQEIALLKAGDPAVVALWAASGTTSKGKIREIAGAADPASRTYAVRVSIVSLSPAMRLGMTTSVTFDIPQDNATIILPLSAFTDQNGKTIAFVVDKQSQTVQTREVQLDGVVEDAAKVKTGLKPGDIVVTGGVQFLRDGLQVRLPDTLAADTEPNAVVR